MEDALEARGARHDIRAWSSIRTRISDRVVPITTIFKKQKTLGHGDEVNISILWANVLFSQSEGVFPSMVEVASA